MFQAYWGMVLILTIFRGSYSSIVQLRPMLDGRIVGGKPIDISEVPFQVSLQRFYHFCGGSLIDKNKVLTAAHCTSGALEGTIHVRIGSKYSTKGGQLVKVKKIYQHEKFNPINVDYDFSILELEDYDDSVWVVEVVNLPEANEDVDDGTLLKVSGWGATQSSSESSESLRSVEVPKVNYDICHKAYRRFGGITHRMICAGLTEGGKDACQGDSGGPLIKNNTLMGIVSWGYGCAQPSYPGVYARVSSVREWIKLHSGV